MFKRLISVLLSAVICVCSLTAAAAAEGLQTATVSHETAASYTRWNGKTPLEAGKNYAVTSDVTISKKVTIPSGTTLMVQNGAKLWINSKGSLYIKGKLNIKNGGTLAVSGKLYQYRGKVLQCRGEMRFGSKANVTLNGKVYVYSNGSVSGKPKSLSVGENAVISCTGANSCQKLQKSIDKGAIEKQLETAFKQAVQDNDIYATVNTLLCKEHVADMDKAFAQSGSSLKAYCDDFSAEYKQQLKDEGIENVQSVDVKITKMTEKKSLSGDEKEIADKYYKGGRVYEVEFTTTIKTDNGTFTEENEILMVQKNKNWFMLG